MKTSNKIILFLLLLPAMVYTLLYVALYAKYKSRSFSIEDNAPVSYSLPSLHTIHLPTENGINATIKYAKDFSIETKASDSLQYKADNGSLYLVQPKRSTYITIYLPELTNLVTGSGNITIESSARFDSLFVIQAGIGSNSIQFGGKAAFLSVNQGDHSYVTIDEQAEINTIDVKLGAESNFSIAGEVGGYESINLGSNTNFSISGENANIFFTKKNN